MLDPYMTTIILIAVILLFAFVLPMLDSIKSFNNSISTRWSIVVIYMALGIGCVVDFEGLSDDTRHFVLLGCFVISILYVVFISLEKWFSNKWIGKFGVTLQHGKTKVHAGMGSDSDSDEKPKKESGIKGWLKGKTHKKKDDEPEPESNDEESTDEDVMDEDASSDEDSQMDEEVSNDENDNEDKDA
jgi:hypothetical protein